MEGSRWPSCHGSVGFLVCRRGGWWDSPEHPGIQCRLESACNLDKPKTLYDGCKKPSSQFDPRKYPKPAAIELNADLRVDAITCFWHSPFLLESRRRPELPPKRGTNYLQTPSALKCLKIASLGPIRTYKDLRLPHRRVWCFVLLFFLPLLVLVFVFVLWPTGHLWMFIEGRRAVVLGTGVSGTAHGFGVGFQDWGP